MDNISNISYNKIVPIEITSLGDCDRLDSKYTAMKANQMSSETKARGEKIQGELANKLQELKKEKAVVIQTTTGSGWLALLTIFFVFSITFLSDLLKFSLYLQKTKFCHIRKRVNKTDDCRVENRIVNENQSVFRQVFEKEKVLFNAYLKKSKNKIPPDENKIIKSTEIFI